MTAEIIRPLAFIGGGRRLTLEDPLKAILDERIRVQSLQVQRCYDAWADHDFDWWPAHADYIAAKDRLMKLYERKA